MFSINPNSCQPIYKQLMEQIRRMIASGQLKPGDSLPSVRDLALTHTVNAMTISKAYNMLETEGLLVRQRGKAMTVSTQNKLSENKQDRLKRLQPAINQLAMAADQLELDPDDVITLLQNKMTQK
jgi:GntR family transcriptional regulator